MKLRIGESNTWQTDVWADGSVKPVAVLAGFDHDKLAAQIVAAVNVLPRCVAAMELVAKLAEHHVLHDAATCPAMEGLSECTCGVSDALAAIVNLLSAPRPRPSRGQSAGAARCC